MGSQEQILKEKAAAEEEDAESLIEEVEDDKAAVMQNLKNALEDVKTEAKKDTCKLIKEGEKRIRDTEALHDDKIRQATRAAEQLRNSAKAKKARSVLLGQQVESARTRLAQATQRKAEQQTKRQEIEHKIEKAW